jgi:L-ribulose-5-phosphate 4-epimerase
MAAMAGYMTEWRAIWTGVSPMVLRPGSTQEVSRLLAIAHETGTVIVETLDAGGLDALEMPAILVASHGPFTWGADPMGAADNAIALELVALIASRTLALDPDAQPMPQYLLDRHYRRKHGSGAYYGQRR